MWYAESEIQPAIRDRSLITGRGGGGQGLQNGRGGGGQVRFYPYKKKEGGGGCLAMLKMGGTKSIELVLSFSHNEGGCVKFPSFKREGGGCAKSLTLS